MAAGSPCAQAAPHAHRAGGSVQGHSHSQPRGQVRMSHETPWGLAGGPFPLCLGEAGAQRMCGRRPGSRHPEAPRAYPGHVAHAALAPQVSNRRLSRPAGCGRGPPLPPPGQHLLGQARSHPSISYEPRDSGVASLPPPRRLQVSFGQESSRCPVPRVLVRVQAGHSAHAGTLPQGQCDRGMAGPFTVRPRSWSLLSLKWMFHKTMFLFSAIHTEAFCSI